VIKKFLLKKEIQLLAVILLLGLFFRTYAIVDRLEFSHDADLYSWIVKDIAINHHFRLIGQLTSAEGIFIGPLFYYSLVPFFLLFNMDPVGGVIPITILGILTLISYYYVFSKLFTKQVGLVITFVQAVHLSPANFARAVVPSTLTNIWVVWYFYCLISIARKNYKVLPLLGILIGLIWHIHIALLPTLIAIPVALIISKKLPPLKQIGYFLIALFITSIPLLAFEIKHGFSQFHNLINNFSTPHGGSTGLEKLSLLYLKLSRNVNYLLFYPNLVSDNLQKIATLIIAALPILLIKKKLVKTKEIIVLYSWIFGVIGFFTISSTIVSEYYLSSIEISFMFFISVLLAFLINKSKNWQKFIFVIFALIVVKNIYYQITTPYYHKGYLEKKALVQFIKQDMQAKGYPCMAVSYITNPGENVGFRYLFWLNNLHVNQPISGAPVYTIVMPDEKAIGAIEQKYGHIGLITPKDPKTPEQIATSCSGGNSNLSDPLFGYTE
jgi:4-amino-4-deoxy-L-arabinose transferase-like glycosyltransferase